MYADDLPDGLLITSLDRHELLFAHEEVGVVDKVVDADSLVRVVYQKLVQKLDAFQRNLDLEGNGPRALFQLTLVVRVRATKQKPSSQDRVEDVRNSPDINFVIVNLSEKLWRFLLWRTQEGLGITINFELTRVTKVCNFYNKWCVFEALEHHLCQFV